VIKYALVFLIGVALGSVVAVATTTFLATQAPTHAAPASKDASAESFGKSFEDAVARALKRVESEAASARASMSAPGESDSSRPKSRRQRDVSADPAPAPDAGEPIARDAATPLREKDADRIQGLVVRSKEARASRRRDWLFLSEAAVTKSLGTPDHISPNENGTETWGYDVEFTNRNNDSQSAIFEVTFNRGRVIDVEGADDSAE